MDFNLNTVSVCDYAKQIKTKANVEADVIVPDTKPDIYRILSVKALADVSERYMRKDKVIFSGKVKFNIMYVGENDKSKICTIEYVSPFNHQAEMPGADDSAIGFGECYVAKTGFDVKNSRKLSVGAILELKAEATRQSKIDAISGDNMHEEIPAIAAAKEGDYLAACKEFDISLSESIALPTSDSECEIYDVSVRPDISEIKTVNNKAVVKGNANLKILYGADGEISEYDTELAFTEIVDIDELSSEHTVVSHFETADCTASISPSDMGVGADIDFKIKGSICAYGRCDYSLVADMYSPDYAYEIKKRKAGIAHIGSQSQNQITVKDSVILSDSDAPVSKIHYMDSSVSCTDVSNEISRIKVCGNVENVVIYSDDSGDLHRIRHSTPFETEIICDNMASSATAFGTITCLNYGYILASSKEIQTRTVVKAEARCSAYEEIDLITDFKVDTKSPIQKSSQPSIVVFYPDSDTDIWDIAKKYNTTSEEIIKVNSLSDSGILPTDGPIIIPKRQKS